MPPSDDDLLPLGGAGAATAKHPAPSPDTIDVLRPMVGAMASLDRERSVTGTLAALGSLRRIAEQTDDWLDRLQAILPRFM